MSITSVFLFEIKKNKMKVIMNIFIICLLLLFISCRKKIEIISGKSTLQNIEKNTVEQYITEGDFEISIGRDGESVTINKYIGKSKSVIIPPYIRDLPVVSIGRRAFYDNQLTSITIPDSVLFIGESAFEQNYLVNISIPNNVRNIEKKVFYNNYLTSIVIPGSVNFIGESAFELNRLTDVEISYGVGGIGGRAFYGNNLTSITIPDSVNLIRESAFELNQLTNVEFSFGLSYIFAKAFQSNNLTSIIIPNTVTTIEESAFAKNNLISITIPDSIFIGERNMINAFEFNNGFNEYYLENGSLAGTYTYDNDQWSGILIERQVIEINGNYKIIAAYSHLYGNPYGVVMEIETEKKGMDISICNNMIFDNTEYQIINGISYGSDRQEIFSYRNFLYMDQSKDYGMFDENIIGSDYTGIVKAMTIKNEVDNHSIFFADNKLIIRISAWEKGMETETEFNHLITSRHDAFFYIAEKIID